jgi:hypothetical protein
MEKYGMALHFAYVGLVGLISLAGFVYSNSKPRKVFISYYSKGDSHFKNLIMAWANNNNLKLNIEDVSTDTKIKSDDETYLRKRMKEQICKADDFIIFIGEETYKRPWVAWEIEQAKIFKKRIIAIKEKKTHKSPQPLLGCGVIWVNGFSEVGIRTALDS